MFQTFTEALVEALKNRIRFEVSDIPGKLGKEISIGMSTRETDDFKQYRAIQIRFGITDQALIHRITAPQDVYREYMVQGIHSIFDRLRSDSARMSDLKESLWERIKFVFKPI